MMVGADYTAELLRPPKLSKSFLRSPIGKARLKVDLPRLVTKNLVLKMHLFNSIYILPIQK